MKTLLMICTVLAVALMAPSSALATDDEQAIAALLDAFLDGASVNDAELHQRFWSEDLVYTSSSGTRFGKAEIMTGLAASDGNTGSDAVPHYSAEAVVIRMFDDTALLTFELVATAPDGEVDRFFNSGVFRRADIGWQAVLWQATRKAE
ncbi:MAG: nuclear transport factor 2 family protein [Wenzhouxiangella sp.]